MMNKHCEELLSLEWKEKSVWIHLFKPIHAIMQSSPIYYSALLREKSILVGGFNMVSTHLKKISQIGSFPQVGVNMKNVWSHHLG